MRVFVTGASGWIGSAVVPELIGAGHQVLGLARSDASAAAIAAAGAEVHRGDLDDLDSLRAGAASSDGVVHLAFIHDFSRLRGVGARRPARHRDYGRGARGHRPAPRHRLGDACLPGRVATERDEPRPGSPVAGRGRDRPGGARHSRHTASGRPSCGCPERCTATATSRLHRPPDRDRPRQGRLRLRRRRLQPLARGARAGRRALVPPGGGAGPGGIGLHAVGDEGVPIRDIAEAIGRHLNRPTASAPAEDFGWLGQILAIDQPASSTLTRELLGWRPVQPGLIEDLDKGHYFG